ncbi:MAG TPA: hypothetical protein VGW38_15955, partial [Chloroflexota bacterium]|nr:hypothetical protein [Chloroflexota bacterium]
GYTILIEDSALLHKQRAVVGILAAAGLAAIRPSALRVIQPNQPRLPATIRTAGRRLRLGGQ